MRNSNGSKPCNREEYYLFLFKDSFIANATTIRGTRYITVSFYGGEEKDIFQKVGDLISKSFYSSNLPDVTNDSLSSLDMDIPEK